jgi:uncharacterized protein (DUF2132 family)
MEQPNNPLHGFTLEQIVTALHQYYGDWEKLGEQINIRCFTHEPSLRSSLKFLRKTPWAREQVEKLFIKLNLTTKQSSEGRAQRTRVKTEYE